MAPTSQSLMQKLSERMEIGFLKSRKIRSDITSVLESAKYAVYVPEIDFWGSSKNRLLDLEVPLDVRDLKSTSSLRYYESSRGCTVRRLGVTIILKKTSDCNVEVL